MTQKLFADSTRASIREAVEADWGTTPAAGTTRARRFTSSSLAVKKQTVVSEEIRDDRMVSDVIETGAMSDGELNWEFAAGTADLDLQRALGSAWSRPMTFDVFRGAMVSVTAANQVTLAGDDYTAYFTVGRRVKLSGFVAAANNDYAEISAAALVNGNTVLTVVDASLAVEGGTSFTTLADANDVIVRKSAALRFGTDGAATIDSNGANAFAAAVAAKQLVIGQRIFVEGVGYETATLTLTSVADNDDVVISDGTTTVTFEAQNDSDFATAGAVFFAIGADDAHTAQNLAAAINTLRVHSGFNIAAHADNNVVTLINLNKTGASIPAEAASFAVTAFSGGNASVGGFYTLTGVSGDVLTVDRAVPTIGTTKNVTIKGSAIRNPAKSAEIILQSMSLETGFGDVSQYFATDGLRVGGMTMDVDAGALIKGTTTTMGRATARSGTQKLTGVGYVALDAAATENVSATANVGALTINGLALSTALKAIKLKIEGNLRNQMAVGSKFPVGISTGRLQITGSVEAYFADGTLYDKFLAHETVSLSFPIIDPDGNTYYFTIPAFKITSDPIAPGGIDQDIMENMEFTAFRDAGTKSMMLIDRFSSTKPVTAL